MRTRTLSLLALFAVLAFPGLSSAQVPRMPRRPTVTAPAPLPPTAGPIARSLEVHRSRWSGEAYSLFSNVRMPAGSGVANYATFGGGTHGGYRFGDRITGTMDLTTSQFGGPVQSSTAEVGTRFMPRPADTEIRPFFDLRAAYMWMSDSFSLPGDQFGADYSATRYARGLGAIAGAGFEYSLTNSFALSTELSALRGRMTAYRMDAAAGVPLGEQYWMTSYRLTLGLKYSATRSRAMAQRPH